ncbi:MAG TPA: MFS transporter, partial [Clostridia bacterium]|nr:MFS transporter [Clostridia bacterium]
MGTLMAASAIPKVIISPIAGVVVDRYNRKHLLVWMDLIRGISVVFIAISAYNGFISIYMVFAAGIVLGICGSFFSPAVNSALPDIVPQTKLVNANSAIGIIQTGSNIVGSSIGGVIYHAFGASFMFLLDGLSYLFSGIIELFIKIPRHEKSQENQHIIHDIKDGYVFVWRFRGLRYILTMLTVLNFVSYIAIVLFLPLFQKASSLGPLKYGIAMAFVTGGGLLGVLFTTFVKVSPSRRLSIFISFTVISCLCFIAGSFAYNFPLMLVLLTIGGAGFTIVNVFINTTIQLTIPQNMRGKVFSLISMLTNGFTPLSMALGGVLGEFFPIRYIICGCFVVILLTFLPFSLIKSFRHFVRFDPETQTYEDLLD